MMKWSAYQAFLGLVAFFPLSFLLVCLQKLFRKKEKKKK